MPSYQSFKGRQYFAPAVIVDVKNELVAPPPLGKSIAVFGDFPQLESGKVYTFTQGGTSTIEELYPQVAKLRNYNSFWRNPVSDLDGQADALSFINCGSNTQASADVDQAATASAGATFKARYWGTDGNNFAFRLETPDSTTTDGAGIQLSLDDNYYRIRTFAPGLGSDVRYEFGYPSQFKLTVNDSVGSEGASISCEDGVLTIDPDSGDAVTFTLADFGSSDDLADAINNTVWSSNAITTAEVLGYDVEPKYFDELSETLADGDSQTFYAHNRALEIGLQSIPSAAIELSFTDGRYRYLAPTSGDSAAAIPTKTTLSGGTQSSADATTYASVFTDTEILGKDFTTCVLESTSASIHRQLKNYIEQSDLLQKERNGWVAAPANLTIDAVYGQYVLPMNSPRISVVAQEITYSDYRGNRKSGTTADCAVLLACIQGGLAIAQPLTSVIPNIIDTTENWNREQDADKLVRKGITAIRLNLNNDLSVIRSVTSYLKDNELYNCELSVRESADASARDLRRFLTTELGSKITSATKDRLKQLAQERLTLHRDQGIIFGFKNVKVRVSGDAAFIEYDVALSNPLNFIRVTANIVSEL